MTLWRLNGRLIQVNLIYERLIQIFCPVGTVLNFLLLTLSMFIKLMASCNTEERDNIYPVIYDENIKPMKTKDVKS